jgi:phage protein D
MHQIKAPALFMWVGDNELSEESVRRIMSLNVTYREKKATDGQFVLSDPDFMFTDLKIFKQGQRLSFMLGWVDELVPCGPFIVKSYRMNAGDDGNPTLEVSFQDLSHKMNKKTKKKKHLGKPADIIKQIAEHHGLGFNIDSIRDLEFSEDYPLIQSNMSDARLIQTLADRYGYAWGIDGQTLYFHRTQNADEVGRQNNVPVLSYRINGATLQNFSAEVKFVSKGKKKGSKEEQDVVDVVGDVLGDIAEAASGLVGEDVVNMVREGAGDVIGNFKGMLLPEDPGQELSDEEEKEQTKTKPKEKKTVKQTKDFGNFSGIFKTVTKVTKELLDDGKDDEESSDSNPDGTPDAKDEAERKAAGRLAGKTEIIEVTLTPRLASMTYRPGDSLVVAGVGERFSGKYRISEVTHSYGDSPSFATSMIVKKRTFKPSKKSKTAIAEQQDKQDEIPGNQNSGSGQPKRAETYKAMDFGQLSGKYKQVTRKVDGSDV